MVCLAEAASRPENLRKQRYILVQTMRLDPKGAQERPAGLAGFVEKYSHQCDSTRRERTEQLNTTMLKDGKC